MRKLLFISSIAALVMVGPARAQMYLPGGIPAAPEYRSPGYTTPGYTAPGYQWREQRANEDWRNNTWRERRVNEDWRNNNWRTQREYEDWRQREEYAKDRTPNNAADRGYVECGVGSVGSSVPCGTSVRDRTRDDYRKDKKDRRENDDYEKD